MNQQNPYQSLMPPPWYPPPLPPNPPPSNTFWMKPNFDDRLNELHDTISLAQSMQKELQMLIKTNESNVDLGSNFSNLLQDRRIDFKSQEMISLDAASGMMSKLRALLEPFRFVADEKCPWEEKSAVVRLGEKLKKTKRNKLWRKRKRKRVAETLAKDRDRFEEVDREVDEWRAREMTKDAAQQKVEKMKEIAKQKAKVERKRLETELEMVLMADKLQELRSLRIEKLKKQGHFIPEEDDKFIERVQAAVEEEERQARAAANTDAAKGAIAIVAESSKAVKGLNLPDPKDENNDGEERKEQMNPRSSSGKEVKTGGAGAKDLNPDRSNEPSYGKYDYVSSLPLEFYHYFHGSSTDLGTLIEVRRTWDAYIRPGGSRIPGHWVQPPPPADEVWASYLVCPK